MRFLWASLLWLVLVVPGAAQEDVYTHLIDGAVDAFARGDWTEARALFERAHVVQPNARALRGLGMSDFNLHLYARATAELEQALRSEVQPLDAALREQVETLLQRTQPYVMRLRLELSPTDARLLVDFAPPLQDVQARVLLDLGEHSLRIEAPEHAPYVQRLVVRSGGASTLSLVAPPLARAVAPSTHRLARWLTLAAGVASLGIGVGTRVGSNHRFDELERSCRARAGCIDGEADLGPTRRLERASYATLGLGAALTVAAFAWWLIDPTEAP